MLADVSGELPVAVDQNLFFARRLGFGLAPDEDLPTPPREWAMEQVRSIPPLDFFGKDHRRSPITRPS